jgi:hypothetical protein
MSSWCSAYLVKHRYSFIFYKIQFKKHSISWYQCQY